VNLFGLNEHYLWASMLWSGISSGYWIYGWKKKSLIPFLGGVALLAITFFIMSALWMSLAGIFVMFAVYWLTKNGY
jgi:hypothetical protein